MIKLKQLMLLSLLTLNTHTVVKNTEKPNKNLKRASLGTICMILSMYQIGELYVHCDEEYSIMRISQNAMRAIVLGSIGIKQFYDIMKKK